MSQLPRPGATRGPSSCCGCTGRDMRAPRRPGAPTDTRGNVMPTAAAGRREAPSSTLLSASLAEGDPELAAIVGRELARQQQEIELIASENFVSRAVLEAAGTVLTN